MDIWTWQPSMEMLHCKMSRVGLGEETLTRLRYDDGKSLEPDNPIIIRIICESLISYLL